MQPTNSCSKIQTFLPTSSETNICAMCLVCVLLMFEEASRLQLTMLDRDKSRLKQYIIINTLQTW